MPVTLFELHTLWHRASRRHKWRPVGTHWYRPAALELMDGSGLKGGHWILTTGERDPNDNEPEPADEDVQGA